MRNKDKHIENKIKESFASQELKAPDYVMDYLFEESFDENERNQIKSAFETPELEAPITAWDTIEKGIVIDNVWERIHLQLTEKRKKRVAFYFWFTAASLIVLSSFIVWEYQKTTQRSKDKLNTHAHADDSIGLKPSKMEVKQHEKQHVPSSNNRLLHQKGSIVLTPNKQQKIGRIDRVRRRILPDQHTATKDSAVLTGNGLTDLVNQKQANERPSELSFALTNLKCTHDLDTVGSLARYSWNGKKWGVGVLGIVGNTWIFNNEVRSGFNPNSITSDQFSMGYNSGLTGSYRFNSKQSLNLDLLFLNRHTQQVSTFSNGSFITNRAVLKSQKVALYWQQAKSLYRTSWQGTSFLGAYAAHIDADGSERIKQFDAGFVLGLGMARSCPTNQLEFGIRTDVGILNINNTSASAKKFDYSNTLILGCYIKYSFFF